MTLGSDEYIQYIKLAAFERRERKFELLRKIFSGLESLNYEVQWEFQYFFSPATATRQTPVVEEGKDENVAWIVQEGVCAVYKKGGNSAKDNLEKWIESSQKELRSHKDFEEFCRRMRKAVRLLPKEANIYIGEIAAQEGVGFESLFSDTGRSIFTIVTTTPEVKYFPVTKPIRKAVWQQYSIKSRLADYVMSVLMYRLKCLENILLLLVKDNEKHHAERAGDFNDMIGSKTLKSFYVQESDFIIENLKTSVDQKLSNVKTRSKLTDLKRAVVLEENKIKTMLNPADIDPLTISEMITRKDPVKPRVPFKGKRFEHFNKAYENSQFKESSKVTIREPEFPMNSFMESNVLIQNYHRLKELSVKAMKRKEQMQKAKENEAKNQEINQIIDGYTSRTRGRHLSTRIHH